MKSPRGPQSTGTPGSDDSFEARLAETREANVALLTAGLRAQEEAAAAATVRERLEELMTGLAEGVIVLESGRILLINPAAQRILDLHHLGAGDDWQTGTLEYRRPDGSELRPEERPVRRAMGGEQYDDLELLILTDGGGPRRCLFSANSVADRHGGVAMAIITVRDVTELRQLEQLHDSYLSLISHDLRSPLSILVGAADRLARVNASAEESERRELIGLIQDGAERMDAMIGQLLRASALESGRLALEKEPIAVPRLAASVVDNCLGKSVDRKIEVVVADGVPPILGDIPLVEHALTNLISNALKYSDPGTPISVTIDSDAEEVIVSVRDRGRGIPVEAKPFVFDRFFRVRGDSGQTPGGYGLGLYIVRLIVEAHGGRIWVDSQPGIGSTFTFTLPVGDVDAA